MKYCPCPWFTSKENNIPDEELVRVEHCPKCGKKLIDHYKAS